MKLSLIEPLEARIAPATLTITPASTKEGDTGTKELVFTVTLSEASTDEVQVAFATEDGTATLADNDYVAKSGTLTFAPGETSHTISISIVGDLNSEADETFSVKLSNAQNATLATATAAGTIENDAKLSISDATPVVEGDTGKTDASFTVTLIEAGTDLATSPVKVHFATSNGTATGGNDYDEVSGDLTFGVGETTKTITVPVVGDLLGEADETFKVTLSSPEHAALSRAEGTGTILNDAKISIADASVLEGDSGTKVLSFTVSLQEADPTKSVTVHYSTLDGTAEAGTDYVQHEGDITFAAGETSKTIGITINGDTVGEADETFKVQLSNATGAVLTDAEATGTILNDAKIKISTPDPVLEGNSGSQPMVFHVTLEEGNDQPVTVSYAIADGAAPNGATHTSTDADYSVAGGNYSGVLTFAPGETSKDITVDILGDTRSELNENFSVTLSGAQHASIVQGTAIGTILDDEAYSAPKISISDVTVVEGDSGFSTAVFTLTLAAGMPSDQYLAVKYHTVDGTAISVGDSKDYTGQDSVVIFAPGETVKTITVQVAGDRMYEGTVFGTGTGAFRAEQFEVHLDSAKIQNSSNAPLRDAAFGEGSDLVGVGTIRDTDALPTVSISDTRVLEGNTPGEHNAQFTVTLSEPAAFDVVIRYSTVAGTATGNDFTENSNGTVTIPAGSKTGTIFVPITGDINNELSETFSVRVDSASLGTATPQSLTLTRAQAVGTIVNDDVRITLDPSTPVTVTEGDAGTQDVTFTVNVAGDHTGPVVVHYHTVDGTAVSTGTDADFQSVSGSLTFQPGETSKTITLKVAGDLRKEAIEQFKLVLEADNAELGGASGTLESTVTINDNDPVPTVTLSSDTPAGGVLEGGKAAFKVTLSAPSNQDVVVHYTLVDGTAVGTVYDENGQPVSGDYDFVRGKDLSVTIPAGQTSATFTVDTLKDGVSERAENFSVQLGDITNGTDIGGATHSLVSASIAADPLPTLSIGDVVVSEGNSGTKTMTFTVTMSDKADRDILVNYATVAGTATADSDYASAQGTLTIPKGSQSATFTVTINGDTTNEADETFFVKLSQTDAQALEAKIFDGEATGTILNDESQFKVLFKDAAGNYTLETLEQAEEAADGSGSKISFIIKRTGDLTQAASVQYATLDGTEATPTDGSTAALRNAVGSGSRADFIYQAGLASFEAGKDESQVFTVSINKDDIYEGTETFKIGLSSPVNGSIDGSQGVVKILDNEEKPVVSFEKTALSVKEGALNGSTAQQTTMVYKVKLSRIDETGTVSVDVATVDGTATSGTNADFTAVATKTLTFAPGQVSQDVAVTVLGDNRYEDDQTFSVKLSNLRGGSAVFSTTESVTDISATGTILNDDAAPTLSISDLVNTGSTGTTYAESDGATTGKYFTITLSAASDKEVTVEYFTKDGTAKAGGDFVGITEESHTKVTFAPGETSKQVFVTINDDAVVEGTETFQVQLASPTGATIAKGVGTAQIVDNDKAIVSINDVTLVEGDAAGTFSKARFSVSLAAAAERDLVVNFATVDGTAKASGAFADYLAKHGSITFAAGETTKEIEIDVINDIYQEGVTVPANGDVPAKITGESFQVKLTGGTDLTFARDTGTATIENGNDSVVGISISDTQVVEGDSGNTAVKLHVELSAPRSVATTAQVVLRNGTAINGSDFAFDTDPTTKALINTVTIPANQTSADFSMHLVGDETFEATEHFFADLSQLPTGVQASHGTAKVSIYNDDVRLVNPRTLQWTDVDGDLVTLKVSKGTLDGNNIGWVTDSNGAVVKSSVGGRTLRVLDLSGSKEFQGASVTITSDAQAGFEGDANGNRGDGLVNVGWIAAGYQSGTNFFGVDLSTVKVDGDLGRIDVGDRILNTAALGKLDVVSLGVHPELEGIVTSSNGQFEGSITSYFQGSVGSIVVHTDLSGLVNVVGAQFGNIGSVRIDGALSGNQLNNSGIIQFSGTLGSAVIGEIVGGTGVQTAGLIGDSNYVGRIGKVVVHGSVTGTTADSGVIVGGEIGSVNIGGSLAAGSGERSGRVISSSKAGYIGKVVVQGDVTGTMADSGVISGGKIGSVNIGGSLVGGSGQRSGRVVASEIGALHIGGDILGGTAKQTTQNNQIFEGESGEIRASRIGSVTVGGSLIGGTGDQSAFIRAASIGTVRVGHDVIGGSGITSGLILADASIPHTSPVKIGSVAVGGRLIGADGSNSGLIGSDGDIGKVVVGDLNLKKGTGPGVLLPDVKAAVSGGAGVGSGRINASGHLGSVAIQGLSAGPDGIISLLGGAGADSGKITANSLGTAKLVGDIVGSSASTTGAVSVQNQIKSLTLDGNLIGGDSLATGSSAVNTTGAIIAGSIGTLHITGDIVAGIDLGGGLQGSGSIGVQGPVGHLNIDGNLVGNAGRTVNIIAFGTDKAAAFGSIAIGKNVEFANIIGGTSIRTTTSGISPVNADAQIGAVTIGGNVKGMNILAGVSAGADGVFATPDDVLLHNANGQIDNAKIYSRIASVIIKGTVTKVDGTPMDSAKPYGIVAQYIGSVKVGGTSAALIAGPGNDTAQTETEIVAGTGFRAFELPIA